MDFDDLFGEEDRIARMGLPYRQHCPEDAAGAILARLGELTDKSGATATVLALANYTTKGAEALASAMARLDSTTTPSPALRSSGLSNTP